MNLSTVLRINRGNVHPDKWGVTEHCKRGLRPIILLPIIDPNTHVQTLKPHCTVQLHS